MVAPLPASVTVLPLQMLVEEADAVTFGSGFTVMATVPVFEHPFALVPVTVYVVVDAGETVTVVPLKLPGIHA